MAAEWSRCSAPHDDKPRDAISKVPAQSRMLSRRRRQLAWRSPAGRFASDEQCQGRMWLRFRVAMQEM